MFYPHVFYHSTLAGVTDSCQGFCAEAETSFPVGCGLFQRAGSSSSPKSGRDALRIEIPLQTDRALVAMRVHTDHVGQIPYFPAARFQWLCSEPSAKLHLIVLEDALKPGVSFSRKCVAQCNALGQRIIAVSYTHRSTMSETAELVCSGQLRCAGHIRRSAYVESDLAHPKNGKGKRMLFSGDLGAPHALLLPAPRPSYGALKRVKSGRRPLRHIDQEGLLKLVSVMRASVFTSVSLTANQEQNKPWPQARGDYRSRK